MDNIIAQHEVVKLPSRGWVDLLHFHQGMVLLIGVDAVALYRDRKAVDDPLANGLLGYEAIPAALRAEPRAGQGQVAQQTSGFIGLHCGAVLFVRPDGVALYPNNGAALHNRECCWMIPFPSVA